MAITNYTSNKILDYNFGSTSYTVPATIYIGLSTTALSFAGAGYTEPSGGNYSRVAVTNNKVNFSIAANGTLNNQTQIIFPESSAAWGTITYVFISDSPTGGNVLYYEALTTPRVVATNTTLLFSAGAMTIAMLN